MLLSVARNLNDRGGGHATPKGGREALAEGYGGSTMRSDDARLSGDERFERQLQRCPDYIKKMFGSLDAYLLGLGGVTARVESRGEGRVYSRGSRSFCRMDPKFRAAWIGVKIQGVASAVIEAVAKVRNRRDKYWIYLTDPEKVDDLKRVLRLAYESRGQ
jgi:hypothetical protein